MAAFQVEFHSETLKRQASFNAILPAEKYKAPYPAPYLLRGLERYDFSGKRIVPFAASGGSGFGKTVDGLNPSVAADAVLTEDKALGGVQTAERLKAWVKTAI